MREVRDEQHVLISELNATAQRPHLPYVWGALRSYCFHHFPHLHGSFRWLDPLFRTAPPRKLIEACGERLELIDYASSRSALLARCKRAEPAAAGPRTG